jgi:hypothetical protein
MNDRRFPILGDVVPPMLGRNAIMQRILGALTKPVPDHLQIVGPRFAGKTVILHELTRRLREKETQYSAVLLWDLGHQTPATDEQFMLQLAQELATALTQAHPDYAKHLSSVQDNAYQDIAEILDLLRNEGKVLIIMDGFDKPLSNGRLTRNLWDQLRELALKPSLRLVTASRRTLRDLIRHPDAQTSDFWNIFEPSPVRVGCFNDDDLNVILEQLSELQLAAGAKTELLNATNGFPVLLLGLLNVVLQEVGSGEVKPAAVVNSYEKATSTLSAIIETLWGECSPSSQDLLLRVVKEQAVLRKGIANADAEILIERGFVYQDGNKLQRPSRLLKSFLEERPHEGNALVRLFGTTEAYQQHFRGVMDHRIDHIIGLDPTLKRYLELGAQQLPEFPEVFLSNVHGILEHSLTLIWKSECWDAETNRPKIHSDWFTIWRSNRENAPEQWLTRFPEGGQRLRLLDLMTGVQNSDRCSRYITKNTYVFANAVQGFRDFGVHPKGGTVELGTAYTALQLCIELAASLTRELPAN